VLLAAASSTARARQSVGQGGGASSGGPGAWEGGRLLIYAPPPLTRRPRARPATASAQVKNVTGRLLVGLRWWNDASASESGTAWRFESLAEGQREVNPYERRWWARRGGGVGSSGVGVVKSGVGAGPPARGRLARMGGAPLSGRRRCGHHGAPGWRSANHT
jgi:hypothetical protein